MTISEIRKIVENDGILFLSYGGFLSQSIISSMTEVLEKEAKAHDINMSISNNMFTIFIELSQNMMNYSKTKENGCRDIKSEGLIIVSRNSEGNYVLESQNIVSIEDKEKIEPKLKDIQTLDRDGIKKRYRELRRSGKDTHSKGGGIGFYEIAKRCDSIEYHFEQINSEKFYFDIRTIVKINK